MWDGVVIGSGEHYVTSRIVFTAEESGCTVSENASCYRVSNLWLELSMTVYKDTPEGEEIARMLEEAIKKKQWNSDDIVQYLNTVLVDNLDRSKLMAMVDNRLNNAYIEGKRSMQHEMRKCLGL